MLDIGSITQFWLATSLFRLWWGSEPGWGVELMWAVGMVFVGFLGFSSVIGFLGIWAERKVAGRIQHRHGPNRVGPFGILQSLADGIKLLGKEDLLPRGADPWLFRLAPYLAFAPVFAAFCALPFGPELVFEPALSAGIFWVIAILSIEVIGVILAGWSSNNKWSTYGAMREACQLISYEIPLGLSILVVIVSTGTLDLLELSRLQEGGAWNWLIVHQPFVTLAFIVFFVASLASNKRAPFDLPESESELVAGYHTEYSGLRFSLFYLAEYNAMFVMSAVMTVLFLGGWDDPLGVVSTWSQSISRQAFSWELVAMNMTALGVFVLKAVLLMFVQMWVRWTLPRPRIDQVLHACFKVLLPLSLVLLVGSSLWKLFIESGSWVDQATRSVLLIIGTGLIGWMGLILLQAFVQGRRSQQRLGA